MRSTIALICLLLALSLTACGGGDDSTTATPTAGASGASGAEGSTGDTSMTAQEFVAAPIPDEIAAVQAAAEADPACDGQDTSPGSDFQVQVAIDAASGDPDTPISEVVSNAC